MKYSRKSEAEVFSVLLWALQICVHLVCLLFLAMKIEHREQYTCDRQQWTVSASKPVTCSKNEMKGEEERKIYLFTLP